MTDNANDFIKPVTVNVIGTGTGDGGSPLTSGTVGQTPDHQPNLTVRVIKPIVALLARAGNVFFVTLSGLVGAQAVGLITPLSFKAMVITSLATTGVGAIKDFATLFSGLERKFPLATGSV